MGACLAIADALIARLASGGLGRTVIGRMVAKKLRLADIHETFER
jgi:hypothetical protein